MASASSGQLGAAIYQRPVFWLIGFCVALGFNVAIILAICYPPHFISQGYSIAQAGWFVSAAGIAGLIGKGLFAWLADALRKHAKWVAAGVLLVQLCGMVLLVAADDATQVIPAICLLGLGGGAFLPTHPYLNSRYFDAAIIGRVNGAQMPLFLPFGLVGAPLAGYAFDQTGTYDSVLIGLAVMLGLAALLAIVLPGQEA